MLLLTLLLGALAHLVLPWYAIALVGLALGLLLPVRPLPAFIYAFLGAALLWGIYSGWLNWRNDGLLAERMGALFGGFNGGWLVLVTALFGGLYGGLGALTGALGRRLWRPVAV